MEGQREKKASVSSEYTRLKKAYYKCAFCQVLSLISIVSKTFTKVINRQGTITHTKRYK